MSLVDCLLMTSGYIYLMFKEITLTLCILDAYAYAYAYAYVYLFINAEKR